MNESIGLTGKVIKTLGVFAVVLILSGWSGRAASAEDACAEDVARFCKEAPAEGGGVLCLRQHENELSPPCRDTLQAFQKRIDDVKRACTTDIDKLCKEIEPGRGQIAKCLNDHVSELTPACAEQMDWLNANMKEK